VITVPSESVPVPVAVNVVLAVRFPVLRVHVQISPTARVLSVFWLLENPEERLFNVTFNTLGVLVIATLALVSDTSPVLDSVTVSVVLVPVSSVAASAVMVTPVLGWMTLTGTCARSEGYSG
jgi:hypothetical protein